MTAAWILAIAWLAYATQALTTGFLTPPRPTRTDTKDHA